MKALVTGDLGFVGGHLVAELERQGFEYRGFDIKGRTDDDFRDYAQVRTAIDDFRPDYIFHIGAQAFVPESFMDPYLTFQTNTIGSLNILEAVRRLGLTTKIHLCGSSEEYGDSPEPLTEDSPMYPTSPYAVSKMAMDHLGQLYADAYGMNVVVTRTFNHTGPGRGEQYAESSFAKQIAEIEAGKRETLEHGNLSPIRNYTDVRDVVKGYIKAIGLPPGAYNICTDQNISVREVLDRLCALSDARIERVESKGRLRPNDFSFSQPSGDKFKRLTGWQPEYDLDQTLSDILTFWRTEI